MLEPSAEQEVAEAATEPTLEELRKAYEAQVLDSALADLGERPLGAAERVAVRR